MSWKRTLFAFAVFVLMVLAYVLDRQIVYKDILVSVQESSLANSVNLSDVDQIYLKNPQGSIRIIKTSVGWQMKEPVDAPADPEIIDTMLTNVTSARKRNDFEAKNLSQYGLGNPEIELSLVTDTAKFGDWGTSFTVQLGFESVYTGQVFASYPGKSEVFTVGEHVKNSLLRSPMDFRRSRLLDIDTGNLEKYTAYRIEPSSRILAEMPEAAEQLKLDDPVTLTNNKGTWSITEPGEAPAEEKVVTEYFNRVGMLRAISYVTANTDRPTSLAAATEALTSPTLTVTLQGAANTRPQQLKVGIAQGMGGSVYVAQRTGEREIMVLTAETVDELNRKPQYFRSRELFALKPDNIGLMTVQIARAAPTALVRNEQGAWELVGDPEFRLDQATINERLATLLGLRIEDYVDLNPRDLNEFGLDSPRIKFTITSKDKTKTETLEVGSSQGDAGSISFARSSSDKGVFTVQMSPNLYIIASQVADKNIFAVDPARLVRAEIDLDDETYELKKDQGEWKLLKPGQSTPATVDIRMAGTFIAYINALEYDRDVSNEGVKVISPNPGPKLQVRFYGENDTPLNEMIVKAKLNRQTITVTNGRGRTFEVPAQDIERVYATAKNLTR